METPLLGSTAAVLEYNCVPSALATLVCRLLKIPCVGYSDDYGLVRPEQLVSAAFDARTGFNDCLEVISGKRESDGGTEIEFFGLTATVAGGGLLAIAGLSLAPEGVRKSARLFRQTREAGAASVAQMQKLAGEPLSPEQL